MLATAISIGTAEKRNLEPDTGIEAENELRPQKRIKREENLEMAFEDSKHESNHFLFFSFTCDSLVGMGLSYESPFLFEDNPSNVVPNSSISSLENGLNGIE